MKNGNRIFYVFTEKSDISIQNEHMLDCTIDDLYTIGATNFITISSFLIEKNHNTGFITDISSLVKISKANGDALIENF